LLTLRRFSHLPAQRETPLILENPFTGPMQITFYTRIPGIPSPCPLQGLNARLEDHWSPTPTHVAFSLPRVRWAPGGACRRQSSRTRCKDTAAVFRLERTPTWSISLHRWSDFSAAGPQANRILGLPHLERAAETQFPERPGRALQRGLRAVPPPSEGESRKRPAACWRPPVGKSCPTSTQCARSTLAQAGLFMAMRLSPSAAQVRT